MSSGNNNIGALRLLFASLVIMSHAVELVDGDQSREPLIWIFHDGISLGGLGVYGFFLISGYLVTKSFVQSRSAGEYLLKRALRIYPGFAVAYLLCVVVIAPFVGGQSQPPARFILDLLMLQQPMVPGVFGELRDHSLNGSMWTIAYEFRFYLLVLGLGLAGLLRRRAVILVLTGTLLAINAADLTPAVPVWLAYFAGFPVWDAQFGGLFGCGALFYLYRDRIRYDGRAAALAASAWAALMFSPKLAVIATGIFGGYLLFWFSFNIPVPALARIGRRTDLSYGVYLYAWPLEQLLLSRGIVSPWVIFPSTLALSLFCALPSWYLIERPAMLLKMRLAAMWLPFIKPRIASALVHDPNNTPPAPTG